MSMHTYRILQFHIDFVSYNAKNEKKIVFRATKFIQNL